MSVRSPLCLRGAFDAGDLEGSPALTFAPLPDLKPDDFKTGSLAAMMERRYEAYKTHVIKPFFGNISRGLIDRLSSSMPCRP